VREAGQDVAYAESECRPDFAGATSTTVPGRPAARRTAAACSADRAAARSAPRL